MACISEKEEAADVLSENEMVYECEPGASKETMLVIADESNDEFDSFAVQCEREGTARESRNLEGSLLDSSELSIAEETGSADPVMVENEVESFSRLVEDQIVDSDAWRSQLKHVFVLSEAGKPIYSRYGSEDKLVTTMGVMQALVSCVKDNNDAIRCMVAGKHRFVFTVHGPIILVAVSQSCDSVVQLTHQLNYVFYQIVSILTSAQLHKIFERRQNYDLRRLLSGSEKFLDNLLHLMDTEPSFLLGAVRCLPLLPAVRDNITQAVIQACAKIKNLVFAIILAGNQLVAMVRMKKYFIHPIDLHIVMNLVSASESFKAAESWTPICLPKFDSSGFLHGHVSYLDDNSSACLLLLTVDHGLFFQLSESKKKIVQKLQQHGCIEAIEESILNGKYKVAQVGVPDLRHFLYKVRSTSQYTGPMNGPPYINKGFRQEMYGVYVQLHQRMHNTCRPLKILHCSGQNHTVMGWVTQGFELYAIFEPLVTKKGVIMAVNNLLRWIKAIEDRLFILNSPTF